MLDQAASPWVQVHPFLDQGSWRLYCLRRSPRRPANATPDAVAGTNQVHRCRIGLEAIYPSQHQQAKRAGLPYLLRGLEINRVNLGHRHHLHTHGSGFPYLVAIKPWGYVLAWRLTGSNTLEVDFCVAALEEALSKGRPQIFNRPGS